MRVRKRAVGLALGAGVLFLIGTNVQAGWLFVLAALLLGALAAGAALTSRAIAGLEIDVRAPAETRQREDTPVDLIVRNRGRSVRWGVVAADEHLGGATAWVGTVRPGERVTVTTMRGAPRRGETHTGWAQLGSAAPFGVAERRARRPADATTLVLPRTEPLGPLPFVETTSSRETATHTEPRRGQGREYLSVREYRAGDPMRHVHWGLTARHGELMVREFEQEHTPRLAIWVDTESDDVEALDRCCTVAASIVDSATATGAGVRLLAADVDGPVLVARTNHLEYHRWLARLGPTRIPAVTALGWLLDGQLQGVGTLVMTFPVWDGRPLDRVCERVAELAARVPRVVLVPVTGSADATTWIPLRAAGADVLPWAAGASLASALGAGIAMAEVS